MPDRCFDFVYSGTNMMNESVRSLSYDLAPSIKISKEDKVNSSLSPFYCIFVISMPFIQLHNTDVTVSST